MGKAPEVRHSDREVKARGQGEAGCSMGEALRGETLMCRPLWPELREWWRGTRRVAGPRSSRQIWGPQRPCFSNLCPKAWAG